LVSLFSGSIESWTEIGIHDQQVKVWIYPEENIISQVFQSGILGGQRITRLASLAPSPQAMLESIAGDPGAIGFIQRSWLSPEVKAIEIGSELKSSVQKPLLALSMSEPQGGIEALIACLQTGPGQESLSVYYGRAE
jgi:ABC-type phosphate transport system substrate-binding protein